MTEINLEVFATAVDVLSLFAETPEQRVVVVETERTLAFRPILTQTSVGLVIPKARWGGLSYSPGEVMGDQSDGQEIGQFRAIQELKRNLRGVRVRRRRGDGSAGFARLDYESDVPNIVLQGPGRQRSIVAEISWMSGLTSTRLPVYLSPSSAANRVSASVLNAMGQAGRKITSTRFWEYQDGRWTIKNSQGITLRVATWPTNP
jgi:hypothetical protein